MQKLILLVCLLVATLAVRAQTDPAELSPPRHELTLTFGLQWGYFGDRNLSPLHYHSGGTAFGLRYRRTAAGGHRWQTGLGVQLGKLNHAVHAEREDAPVRYGIDLYLGYLRRVGAGQDVRNWVGANVRSVANLTFYDGSEAVTFLGLHGLEAAYANELRTGDRHRLSTELSVPLFALLSRPPYTGWDKFIVDNSTNIPAILTRGDWVPFGRFRGLRAAAAWSYDLSDRFTTTARYQLAYYATKRRDPLRQFDNTFSFSSTLKF